MSPERLEMGVAYCDPWFDGSLIMVDKLEPPEDNNKPNYGNWTLPFEPDVWYVTLATIFFSCFVYQILEMLGGEREERSYYEWFCDNLYLSFINFTQNYSYEPTTLAGRIFGISFSFWTMLIGAAYTANLASLLVERPIPINTVESINDGITRGMSMCTHQNSFSDIFIKSNYGQAKRIPQPNPEDMYNALNDDQCDILIGTTQAWLGFQTQEEYNPDCYLEWVGRTVHQVDAAFTTTVDPGVLCTGLVNEAFNYYLSVLKAEGFFTDKWDEYYALYATPNFSCNTGGSDDGGGAQDQQRRQLVAKNSRPVSGTTNDGSGAVGSLAVDGRNLKGEGSQRELKGGGGGTVAAAAAVGGGGDEDIDSLTLTQMAGTFLLHAIGSTLALIIAIYSSYGTKRSKSDNESKEKESMEKRLDALQSSQAELSNQMAMILSRLNSIQQKLDGNDDTSAMMNGSRTEEQSVSTFSNFKSFLTGNSPSSPSRPGSSSTKETLENWNE